MKRRDFVKLLPFGAIVPGQVLGGVSVANDQGLSVDLHSTLTQSDMDEIYRKAIVFDGLIIARGWNQDSFRALDMSGYTGFNASVDSGSLARGLKNLEEWQKIIAENPNRLISATRAEDFVKAKKENKTAIFLGFQNSTMVESSIDNIDKLYAAGTRWMQLTYNERNLVGDGCTERTNAGLSDFGIEVVERMNELGMIVDLSHCGAATTNDGQKSSPCKNG